MQVKQIVNTVSSSNTYIISDERSQEVWLIDIGDFEGVFDSISNDKSVKGVFLTHPHFDHIYGINKLLNAYPDCKAFASEDCNTALFCDKLNLSFYHNDPVVFLGTNVQILKEDDKIAIFDDCHLEIMETPGHHSGCLTYRIENYLFTGDSFIPGVKVVTKLKGGDREANKISLMKIMDNISVSTIVCPGHGPMTKIVK